MELKLTTVRALKYEEKTGNDILEFMKKVADTGLIKIKDVLELFMACGEGYNETTFDAWDASFSEKAVAVMEAVKVYIQGKNV